MIWGEIAAGQFQRGEKIVESAQDCLQLTFFRVSADASNNLKGHLWDDKTRFYCVLFVSRRSSWNIRTRPLDKDAYKSAIWFREFPRFVVPLADCFVVGAFPAQKSKFVLEKANQN